MRSSVLGAALCAIVVGLSGCASAQPDSLAVTCLNLLDKTNQEYLVSKAESGLAIIDGWSEKQRREGSVLARFEDLGGVVCAIGFVGTDNVADYGWSPINEASKTEIRPVLAGQGMVTVADPRGELWCIPAEMAWAGHESCFLFRANDWFYADEKHLLATYIAAVDGR